MPISPTMFSAKHLFLFGIFKVLCIIYANDELTTGSVPRIFRYYSSLYMLSSVNGDFYTFDYNCKMFGLVQATVQLKSHLSFLLKFLKESKSNCDLWIGGSNIGSMKFSPRYYYWNNNGEELTYSNWAPGYPPSENITKCIYINQHTFLWQTDHCLVHKIKFVCMHPYYADMEIDEEES